MIYYARANVGGPGDVASVPEPPRHVVDRLEHILLSPRQVLGGAELSELDRRDQGPRPGTKVLGRELGAHDLLYVGVQVTRLYVPDLARIVVVLEDLISGQGGALLARPPQPGIGNDLALLLPPFSRVLEDERIPLNAQVLAPEGGYAVGLVLPGVAFLTHAEVCSVHQARHGRKNLLPVEVFVPQMVGGYAAHLGKHIREAQDPLELLALLALPILGVVEVLQPARGIVADRLDLGRRRS